MQSPNTKSRAAGVSPSILGSTTLVSPRLWKELAGIEGHEILQSPDRLQLSVLERKGTDFVVRPDQVELWTSSSHASEFEALLKEHKDKF